MARLTDMELARAFVPRNTQTFADVIATVERRLDLKASRRRDLVSGLKRVASAIDWQAEDCPADPVWLRPRLGKIKPAALGITRKTWTTIVSNARSALAEVGIIECDRGSPLQLSSDWRSLWDAALATGDKNITIPLSRFVRFCANVGLEPGDVTDTTATAFGRALELSEIRKDPDSATWQAIHAWNLAVERVPSWPQSPLTKPVRHNHYALPSDAFPATFGEDLHAILDAMARPVRQLGAKRRQPLSDATIEHRKRQWIRFASALVHAGVPIEELSSLRDLLDIDRVECGIEWLAATRQDGQTSPGLHEMALGLCTLGREIGIDETHLEELREFARMLSGRTGNRHVRNKGLTEKNRERLRQFRDPSKRNALLCLPADLMTEAARVNELVPAARLAEVALAIAIETIAPIRLKNLASLRIDRHFDRSVPGQLYLSIPDYEVKNGAPLEFQLPDRVRHILDTFLSNYRPCLIATPCPWLFAREDGTAQVHQTVLARRITETIEDRLGVDMNVHLFRHLAAMLILDADPGAYDLVRRILGHSELSTTLDAYSGMESISATRLLSDLVETAHEDAPCRNLRKPRR